MTNDKTQITLTEINQELDDWYNELAVREMKLKPVVTFDTDDFDGIISLLNEVPEIDLIKN